MSQSSGTTTNTSSTAPATFQMPFIQQMMNDAQKLYGQSGPNLYEGQFTAPLAPGEVAAQQGITGTAVPKLQQLADSTMSGYNYNLTTLRDPNSNPYLAGTAQAAIRPVFDQLMQQALPSIRQGYRATGGTGGSREALAQTGAIKNATQQALDSTTGLYNNAWNTGNQLATQTLGMQPTVANAQLSPWLALSGTGAQNRAYQQAMIDEARQRYEYGQNLPYTKLAEFSNLVSRPFGSTGTSSVQAPASSTASQIGGAGLTGLGLLPYILGLFQ